MPSSNTLKLPNKAIQPPGGWTIEHPVSGRTIRGATFEHLVQLVREEYVRLNMDVPVACEEQVEDALCRRLPPGDCEPGRIDTGNVDRLSFGHVFSATSTLLRWLVTGRPKASIAEREERSRICAQCPENVPMGSCSSCSANALRRMLNTILANEQWQGKERLQVCRVCGCALAAKVSLDMETVQASLSEEQKHQLPAHCWILNHAE
jgi:hypothetical protein